MPRWRQENLKGTERAHRKGEKNNHDSFVRIALDDTLDGLAGVGEYLDIILLRVTSLQRNLRLDYIAIANRKLPTSSRADRTIRGLRLVLPPSVKLKRRVPAKLKPNSDRCPIQIC